MATGNDALPSRVGGRDEYSAFHELQNHPLHTYTVYIQDRINLQSLIHIPEEKTFLSGIAQITSPPSPQFGQVVPLFLDVKNDVLARITEPSNNDYDTDWSDNCDYNFVNFDDFGDQKVYT